VNFLIENQLVEETESKIFYLIFRLNQMKYKNIPNDEYAYGLEDQTKLKIFE
jgi:hypothetical protein